jgi:hypothetical protein
LTAAPVGVVVLVEGIEGGFPDRMMVMYTLSPREGIMFGDIHRLKGCVDGFGG